MTLLPHEIVETDEHPEYSVIWLHGLGASGHDFVPIVPELRLPTEAKVRFIFPHAPARPVSVNGGYVMPSWYDIYEMDIDRKIDVPQIQASAKAIHQLIDQEVAHGIPSQHIVLAGFSQGGAVAYQAALTYPKPLAGLLAMSTYFATPELCELSDHNRKLPILVQHGTADAVVPESLGQRAIKRLTDQGWSAEYKTYPMDHEVCLEQIQDISTWLVNRFN